MGDTILRPRFHFSFSDSVIGTEYCVPQSQPPLASAAPPALNFPQSTRRFETCSLRAVPCLSAATCLSAGSPITPISVITRRPRRPSARSSTTPPLPPRRIARRRFSGSRPLHAPRPSPRPPQGRPRFGRPPRVVPAHRGPGQPGLVHGQRRGRVIEYYERKAFGRHLDASRLFLYKVTRNLMKMKGDTGAYLREDDERDGPLRRAARGVLALHRLRRRLRQRAAGLLLRLRPELPGDPVLPPRSSGNVPQERSSAGSSLTSRPASLDVRLHGLPLRSRTATPEGPSRSPARPSAFSGGHAIVAVGYDDRIKIKGKGNAAGPDDRRPAHPQFLGRGLG